MNINNSLQKLKINVQKRIQVWASVKTCSQQSRSLQGEDSLAVIIIINIIVISNKSGFDERGRGRTLLSSVSHSEHIISTLTSLGKEGGGAGLQKRHSHPLGRCYGLVCLFVPKLKCAKLLSVLF